MDIITTHINADFDCLGAMIAAHRLYPDAVMVFPGALEKGVKDYLLRNKSVASLFTRIRDLDLSLITRMILVDVRTPDRIGPLAVLARQSGMIIHIYDHHTGFKDFIIPDYARIEPVGASVTILTELLVQKGIVPLPQEATIMMLGLYEDTGSLQFTSTTERDYLAAATLLRYGADLSSVAASLVQEFTADQVDLLHELLKSRHSLNINGIEITVAHAAYPHFVGDIASLAHRIKDMDSLETVILVVQMGERLIMVGRSRRSEVPMGEILREFGGGGHAQAASASVKEMTLIQVLEALPAILLKHVAPHWCARDLMTTPVKSVAIGTTVKSSRDFLTRYNINAMPVLAEEKVVGLLTRQILDKAAHHGLEDESIDDFMSRDFFVISPQDSIEELKARMFERDQRFVPVVEAERLVGAITRTDLLRYLVSEQSSLPEKGAVIPGGALFKRRPLERLMKERLSPILMQQLAGIGEVADRFGSPVYLVGGFVRDLLLHKQNFDIDLVVEGAGIAFAEALAEHFKGRVRAHAKFGTAVVVCQDNFKIDVATARMEYYLYPGALPTVEEASLKLDLYRRDFTINTLAIALNHGRFGELYDFFDGQSDLDNRVIRVLHNLSFVEDPTRTFRAIRFAQRLGFSIAPHTESLLRSAVRMGFVEKISGPRLANELIAILQESDPLPVIREVASHELLRYVHRGLIYSEKQEKSFKAAAQALNWHQLLYTGETVKSWLVFFLCLTEALDDDEAKELTGKLQLAEGLTQVFLSERSSVHDLLKSLKRKVKRAYNPRESELFRWFNPLSTEVLLYLTSLTDEDAIRRWISHYFIHLRAIHPELNGNDLRELGFIPGPIFRQILNALCYARLDGEVRSRNDEISFVKKRFAALRPPSR